MTRTRRIIIIVIVIFAIYAVVQDPVDSAANVRWVWDHILDGMAAVGRFFDELLSG